MTTEAQAQEKDLTTTFCLSMFNEAPNGVPKQAIEVQRFFCRTACDISNIVRHTCGVERAGKAYKLMIPKAEP